MLIGWSLPAMIGGLDRAGLLAWCRRIEEDGYSTIGFGERIAYQNLEMFSTLSAAAAVTERVRIMSSIVVLPMHSEAWVAKQSATLDVISGGRYTLGVGVGGRNEDYRTLDRSFERRFGRLDAQVAAIRDLWAQNVRPGGSLPGPGPHPDPQRLDGAQVDPALSPVGGRHRRVRDGSVGRRVGPQHRVDGSGLAGRRPDDCAVPHDELLVRPR